MFLREQTNKQPKQCCAERKAVDIGQLVTNTVRLKHNPWRTLQKQWLRHSLQTKRQILDSIHVQHARIHQFAFPISTHQPSLHVSHISANTAGMLRAISTERFLRVSKPRFWQRIPCSIYSSPPPTNQTGSDKKEATKDVLGLRWSIKGYGLIVIQSFCLVGFDETEIQY